MNPDDMKEHGRKGEILDIASHFLKDGQGRIADDAAFLLVPYEIPRRCVATHFPEANVLMPIDSVALRSNLPASKAIVASFAPPGSLAFVRHQTLLPSANSCS
jgi:hypothetical protein